MDEIKKAVTSEAAITEKQSEETMNAENAPSIQDSKSLLENNTEVAAAASEQIETQEEAAKPEPQQLSFDGLFADSFSLGSTLRQDAQFGGNVISNIKNPSMDYVERAKNLKNQKLSSEELKELNNKK